MAGFKKILWLLSIVGLLIIFLGIKKTFWQDGAYQEAISQTQKEGNYLPYRIRKIIWNQGVIIKTAAERTGEFLWFETYLGLGGVTLYLGIKRKKRIATLIFLMGLLMIGIEKDPNPGYYFRFLIANLILIWWK